MSVTQEARGSCLCGAVRLTLAIQNNDIAACHCGMCRRWGGGPLLALEGVDDVRIDGQENVSVYVSSEWAERGFCRQCGTHLFYRLGSGEHYAVPVGLVDAGETWNFDQQIFVDEKPAFYAFANQTRNMTGQQAFEAFSNASQD